MDFLTRLVVTWFILAHMIIGPFVRLKVSKPLFIAELGRQLYFYNENLDNSVFKYINEKVKIYKAASQDFEEPSKFKNSKNDEQERKAQEESVEQSNRPLIK
jgi:hypothetical protein